MGVNNHMQFIWAWCNCKKMSSWSGFFKDAGIPSPLAEKYVFLALVLIWHDFFYIQIFHFVRRQSHYPRHAIRFEQGIKIETMF